jgi:hypothetical protein
MLSKEKLKQVLYGRFEITEEKLIKELDLKKDDLENLKKFLNELVKECWISRDLLGRYNSGEMQE